MRSAAMSETVENIIPILRVADLARSTEFYHEVLGCTTDWSMEDFACLSRDGWRLYLTTTEQGAGSTWLWIGVHDLAQVHRECVDGGAAIIMEPTNYPWAKEFRVQDPDGHVLRIGGEPDPV
jgi:predicted enzyme related to lactoylglutathione lyase